MKVSKNNNEIVEFDISKLKSALFRTGATNENIDSIISEIEPQLFDGIPTRKIYRIAFKVLRKKSKKLSAYYSLKKALMEFGPTGYPFEVFVSRLLKIQGYDVQVGQIINGKCVTHEVDVVAINSDTKMYVECKFHQTKGHKNDVKIPLYINSRFHDIKNNLSSLPENKDYKFKGMIVTNTRFTSDAIDFGNCAGLQLISWDYPTGNSLRDWIDKSNYHPITCLNSANREAKQKMLNNGIVICKDIFDNFSEFNKLGIKDKQLNKIIKEAKEILN
jgi:hypothetical protein